MLLFSTRALAYRVYLSASALDSSFNIYILAELKRVFLAKCKGTFTIKKRRNKEEIETVHERNLQISRIKIVSAIFHLFNK